MASNMYRDTTIEAAKARHLQVIWDKKVKSLAKQTAFSEYELQALCLIFHKICETHEWWGTCIAKDRVDRLDRLGFRDGMSALTAMSDGEALDALFGAQDANNKRYVTAGRWIRALSALQGTDSERAALCWRAYLKAEAGSITRSDMAARARNMFVDVGQDDFDGFCKEFVDTILRNAKAGKEGFMPQDEYLEIVRGNPLFTEFLLTVLPSRDAFTAFLATFSPPPPRQPRRPRPGHGRSQ